MYPLRSTRPQNLEPISFKSGDTAIIVEAISEPSFTEVTLIHDTESELFSMPISHNYLLKMRPGQKFRHTLQNGMTKYFNIFLLNSNLWRYTLDLRTQILYTPDIAQIISCLELAAGDRVVEAGTGSGCLSHALCEVLGEKGHLFTYEYNENRYNCASEEFKRHNLNVTITHRDVQKNGFLLEDQDISNSIDGLFLDVPEPWNCVEHIVKVLRPGAIFVNFSPCVEQVQKVIEALSATGDFSDFKTFECYYREFNYLKKGVQNPDILAGRPRESTEKVVLPLVKPCSYVFEHQEIFRSHTGYLSVFRYAPFNE